MNLEVQHHFSLKEKHTFGLDAKAEAYVRVDSITTLKAAMRLPYKKKMILGGGSNVVFTADFPGLVIEYDVKGIWIERQFDKRVHLWVGGGVNWHETVLWTLQNNMGGLENLSLIPGKVGASPIQNIGAYGIELKDVFVKLKALEIATGKVKTFFKKDCQFAYRNSFFKQQGKGKFVILQVCFSLTTHQHKKHTAYGAITAELDRLQISDPSPHDISKAIIHIRLSKLPDPKKIGNAGSFFKNPIISKSKFKNIQSGFPDIVHYDLPSGKIKLAAGWLIDQCGWKGKGIGDIKVHEKQALVLTNQGNGNAQDLLLLIEKIKKSVATKYGVSLEAEVNLM